MRKSSKTMMSMTDDQIHFHLDFVDKYISGGNAATASVVDQNANVEHKTIASLIGEVHKGEDIQLNRRLVQEQLVETFGPNQGRRLAKQYIRDLEDHLCYCHDEQHLLKPYCCAISLNPMLQHGTAPLGGKSGPPKHLHSYVGQTVTTMMGIAAQIAGACGAPGFLPHFDVFARADYGEDYLETSENEVRQALETWLYAINEPVGTRNSQSIFSNISVFDQSYFDSLFGLTYYPTLPELKPNWESYNKLQAWALDVIREANTHGVLTFPVKTATILHKDGKPVDEQFVDMVCDDLSKGSLMFLYMSDSVDSLSSCCRLRSDISTHEFTHSLGAGSISVGSSRVITLNINRITQEKKNLKSVADRVAKYLVAHRKLLEKMNDAGMYPIYTQGYGDLDRSYLTIGTNGVVEAAESLGIPIRPDGEYPGFVDKILATINASNAAAESEYGYRFNLEFTPSEGLGSKNAKWDREDGLRVPRDAYNSYLYPVEDKRLNVVDKFRLHGKDLSEACSGGQALHLNLDENPSKEGYRALVDLAIKTGCSYWCTNVLRTCCEDCNHVSFEKLDSCSACESTNISHATRVIGYLKKITSFSAPRQKEAALRVYHKEVSDSEE